MTKIIEKIELLEKENPEKKCYSFEYFPPKTDVATEKLYATFDKMKKLKPMWVDVTWGAGGSTADKTVTICEEAAKKGLDVMMHLTCTNMERHVIDKTLAYCKEIGIRNILALRGDPPVGQEWQQIEGGFAYAQDLVRYIRQQFGDYFCIGVAGYPEGHTDAVDFETDMIHLKEKIVAGADLIITQLFYDVDYFINYVSKCREMGITVPILPGIMPIQSYGGFKRMTTLCKTIVPQPILDALEDVKEDSAKVKAYGVELATKMCEEILTRCEKLGAKSRVTGLHFYTLNLEESVLSIVNNLGLLTLEVDDGATTEVKLETTASDSNSNSNSNSNNNSQFVEGTVFKQ